VALRVAVLGASGFGKHHAKWYSDLGCEVVAFLGSSAASVSATAQALREAFGFRGRGHTSLAQLLLNEQCDAVSVCTPPALHERHAFNALEAGCAVLCEKPLVWQPGASSAELLEQADALVAEAERNGVLLSVNTQYAAAAEVYRQLAPAAPHPPKRFFAEMTSKLKPGGVRGRDLWLDLMPHTLSMLLALLPDARLNPGTVHAAIGEDASRAEFEVTTGGKLCGVEIRLAKLPEPPFPRRFGFDDAIAEVGTRPDETGAYRGYLRLGDREQACDDFMQTSIARFCAAVRGEGKPLVEPDAALDNLEIMLTALEEAELGTGRL